MPHLLHILLLCFLNKIKSVLPCITMKAISCLSVLLESIFCIVPILKPYFGEGTIIEIAFLWLKEISIQAICCIFVNTIL
jgi:hypothetical protein